jgi:hypothetical protein
VLLLIFWLEISGIHPMCHFPVLKFTPVRSGIKGIHPMCHFPVLTFTPVRSGIKSIPNASFSGFKIHAGTRVVQFGVNVVNVRRHFPVLKITRDWCIKN